MIDDVINQSNKQRNKTVMDVAFISSFFYKFIWRMSPHCHSHTADVFIFVLICHLSQAQNLLVIFCLFLLLFLAFPLRLIHAQVENVCKNK